MYTPLALTMELENFISGERFQALADISFIPIGNSNGESECGFVRDQQRNNNYNIFLYDENTTVLPDMAHVKTIFVNTWTLDKFLLVIFPLLPGSYTFISHNSDLGIEEKHHSALDSEKVVAWFSQNTYTNHPKLVSLPIGLGNQQYPHGDVHLLKEIMDAKTEKQLLVFKNFNIDTNPSVRIKVNIETTRNQIDMWDNLPQHDYLNRVAQSAFVISPPGNGMDCHRIWECIYLKAIPVVQNNTAFTQFRDLPILFIDDWNSVTNDFLRNKLEKIPENKLPAELMLDHWRSKILRQMIGIP